MIKHDEPDKLSVCMIVRNEAANIQTALESAHQIADEIIINDTGSKDNTIKIIEEYEAPIKLFKTKWDNNFAKARNLTLKYAQYGWIMWLDADDYIPKESIERIQELKKEPLNSFKFFNIINTKNGSPIGHKFLQCRFFPNSDSIYFENPVHERVTESCMKRGLQPIGYKGIKIHHRGYESKHKLIQKSLRNIELIKSIPGWEESYEWLKDIGIAYTHIDEDMACEYFLKASFIRETPEIYCKLGNANLKTNPESSLKYYIIGLENDPDNIEINFNLAKCYEYTEKWDKAITQYKKVLQIPDIDSIETIPYDYCRLYAFHYLMRIYTAFGYNSDAVELIQQMNTIYPLHRLDD